MKLLSFEHRGRASYGVAKGGGVVDVGRRVGATYPTLRSLIAANALDEARRIADGAAPDHALDEITFLPVITDPEKILAVGLNYARHANEVGSAIPEKPAVFLRTRDSLTGHLQPILKPRESDMFDFEVELCIVIGKAGRRIAAKDAHAHIAGYTIMNEGSLRDWQKHSNILIPGKNFYHSGAVGPWMVEAADVGDPENLRLTSRIDGEIMQDSRTSDFFFGIPAMIEYISTWAPLAPGDLIATGTPEGVGAGRKPPRWLKPGETLEMEIENIGVLRNPVVAD